MTDPDVDYGPDAELVDTGAVDRVEDEPWPAPEDDPLVDETAWELARSDLSGHPLAAPDVRGAIGEHGEQWLGPPQDETGVPAAPLGEGTSGGR